MTLRARPRHEDPGPRRSRMLGRPDHRPRRQPVGKTGLARGSRRRPRSNSSEIVSGRLTGGGPRQGAWRARGALCRLGAVARNGG